jgi:drug/metabolite transporter (DMT)-like permease
VTRSNPRKGILLMILSTAIFACQDAISRHLGSHYSIVTIVAIRFWVFAAFVLALAASRSGGIRRVARSRRLGLQILRGLLLAAEVIVMVVVFVKLGLIGAHAVFSVYPLLVAALAGPVLGEYVGWRRGVAILVGLAGVLVILRPGFQVFSPWALVALIAALMFAVYGLLTRLVASVDGAETSFFWTGVAAAGGLTLVAPFFWTPITDPLDMALMGVLCLTAIIGHFVLIKAYSLAEAGVIQPFSYFQLVFIGIIGYSLFGERPDGWTLAGAGIILSAGLYALIREARTSRKPLPITPPGPAPEGS